MSKKSERPKVFVVGEDYLVRNLFWHNGFTCVDGCEPNYDVIVFTGGGDVSPEMYGEENVCAKGVDRRRDAYESELFENLLKNGSHKCSLMVGICRGAQLLNVMNGGRLWQDVDNHALLNTHSD